MGGKSAGYNCQAIAPKVAGLAQNYQFMKRERVADALLSFSVPIN
jgi:hypothetical protein